MTWHRRASVKRIALPQLMEIAESADLLAQLGAHPRARYSATCKFPAAARRSGKRAVG